MKTATLIIAATLACGVGATVSAQPATGAAAQPGPSQVEPQAVQALTRMSAYLRTIPAFRISLKTQRDDVDPYGQVITLSGQATYSVRRPDAFNIDLALPGVTQQYLYDGKTVTVYDPKAGSYGRVQAPSTIRATLELAKNKYGATVPLEDLFTWTEGDSRASALTSAHFIGKDQIGGQSASHYAFRQPGVDWQIWIADGDKPAPLRINIVASSDPARPRFEADLAWDTSPQFAANTFAFAPPPNARAVSLNPVN
jgi:hypothetical protein